MANQEPVRQHKWTHGLALAVLFLGIGTVTYRFLEGWRWSDSFYFSTMTLTTVGYGDLVPSSLPSKLFTSFYAIFGIGVMLYVLSSGLGQYLYEREGPVSRILAYWREK